MAGSENPKSLVGLLLGLLLASVTPACNDGGRAPRAHPIFSTLEIIGGPAALATVGDYILENDRIRVAFPAVGNSAGPGVFGGSLMDADVQRPEARFRGGNGLDQFAELFPIGNLSVPAICEKGPSKIPSFCDRMPNGVRPSVTVLCDGSSPCLTCSGKSNCQQLGGQIDLSLPDNADYADPQDPTKPGPQAPSAKAAVLRVEGQSGNYLEALSAVSAVGVKSHFRFRNDYILEPGVSFVRIRTQLAESDLTGSILNPGGRVMALPPLNKPEALFGILLGSSVYPTELPGMEPGIAGGDFLFFGERLKIFAPGIGFDIYKEIRTKFALGQDPLNNPIAADFLAGVGENVSYAIANADPGGKYLLPIYSGAVTAGFSHGAHCHTGSCPGTPEQCTNVVDCSQVQSFVFERLFAVGDGDVASAARSLYDAWKVPTGQLRGHVIDAVDGSPITAAEVYLFAVPATMADCYRDGDPGVPYTLGAGRFAEACLEKRFYTGAVNHLRSDRRASDLPEGAFDGFVPTGRYYAMAKKLYHPASEIREIEVKPGETTELTLALLRPARVQFVVQDESNRLLPSKFTVGQCLPNCAGRFEESCSADADCASGKCLDSNGGKHCLVDNCGPDRACNLDSQRCDRRTACQVDTDCEPVERCRHGAVAGSPGACVCEPTFMSKTTLGEPAFPLGVARYLYTSTGQGELEMEPGSYDVWASRGFEYSVDKQQLAVASGRAGVLSARLVREVDTHGWVSGDFHVHGQNSYDAVVKHRDRVTAFAGEGVEVLSTSDHDYITDLSPYVIELGLEPWLTTQVGIELTTVEIGHFLGFPFRYREWESDANDQWVPVRQHGAIDWTGKVPNELFKELRALGEFGPDDTVVVVAHPRDSFFGYFSQYNMNSFNPSQIQGSFLEWSDLLVKNPIADPANFDGGFDALELFNSKRYELVRTPTVGEMRDYSLARAAIQNGAGSGASPDTIEAQLKVLDRFFIRKILKRTASEQEANWASDGSEKCDLIPFCTSDAQCDSSKGLRCDLVSQACYKSCTQDSDCSPQACANGHCDLPAADHPCSSHPGVVDDWFRLLDYGVVRTGMANSDTHQLFTQTEAGLPRNFIRLSADEPLGIDRHELAKSIKAGHVVGSYGPFVELWLNQAGVGDTLSVPAGTKTVSLRIRVQSPHWFDVDRVEVYRSGHLIHAFSGDGDELDPNSTVDVSGLKLPNPGVVKLDASLQETVPAADAWYVVVAMGLEGRDLSPVYSENPYLSLEIGDIMARSFGSIPLIASIAGSVVPRVFRVYPLAITNPVFLDVDGNGSYDAPHPVPDWAKSSSALQQHISPLVENDPDPKSFRARQIRAFERLLHGAVEHGRAR